MFTGEGGHERRRFSRSPEYRRRLGIARDVHTSKTMVTDYRRPPTSSFVAENIADKGIGYGMESSVSTETTFWKCIINYRN